MPFARCAVLAHFVTKESLTHQLRSYSPRTLTRSRWIRLTQACSARNLAVCGSQLTYADPCLVGICKLCRTESGGKLFHTRRPAASKVRSPTVTQRVGGTSSADVDAERSRGSMFATERSSGARCCGAVPCGQQKTRLASLNSIR